MAVKSFTAVFLGLLENIAVISINDFRKLVWAKSYLGAIGRNFVSHGGFGAMAPAPLLNDLLDVDSCKKIYFEIFYFFLVL